MPTYIPLEWSVRKLIFKINPTGIRKFIRIPYLFHFPYFSGTMLKLGLEIHNDSKEDQDIHYQATLFRLAGIPQTRADHIKQTEGDLTINPKRKIKQPIHLTHLPQPGNYSLRLYVNTREGERQNIYGDVVYLDALPRDASAFNVTVVIISGLIGVILGLVLGRLVN